MMSKPIDVSVDDASAGDNVSGEGKTAKRVQASHLPCARGFSAMMYREISLRTSTQLGPKIACTLKALLRGDHVTARERAALFHAASLETEDESAVYAQPFTRRAIWEGMLNAANSNKELPNPGYLVVPLHPHRSIGRAENHVLQKLGLSYESSEEDF
jgi:hypothetical protein